jgi:CHAT domain
MVSGVSALRVVAVSYLVDREGVHVLVTTDTGTHWSRLNTLGDERARVDDLRRELRDTQSVSEGLTPRLEEFSRNWGRALLPPEILAEPPDVLVIVPSSWLHDLPLHLVRCDGRPLGALCGVTYASSHTLFIRCTERNRRRGGDGPAEFDTTPQWTGPRSDRSVILAVADVKLADDHLFDVVARAVAGAFTVDDSVTASKALISTAEMAGQDGQETPDVLCLVAHGWIDPEDRLASGLLVLRDMGLYKYFQVTVANQKTFRLRLLPFAEPPASLGLARPTSLLSAAQLEIFFECRQELVLLLGWSRHCGTLTSALVRAGLNASSTRGIAAPCRRRWRPATPFVRRPKTE